MAHEASRHESSRTGDPLFPVLERLRPALATLMGKLGYRGFLARALAAAGEEVRWLRAVHVKSDGSLMGLQELQAQLAPAQFFEGRTVMLAQLLGSLVEESSFLHAPRHIRQIVDVPAAERQTVVRLEG